MIEYSSNCEVNVPINSIIKYGVHNNYIDVTELALNNFVSADRIIIPSGDHARAAILGDPLPYVLKSIFVVKNNIHPSSYLNKYNDFNETNIDKNNGLNNFDIIYYINLDHRRDRFEYINGELNKTNIEKNKINRFSAIYVKDFGALGCAKSHCLVLEEFLKTPDTIKNCIILEDDFIFNLNQEDINKLVNNFFNSNLFYNFDILMLSGNTQNEENTEYPFLTKILDSQTTSGYCVNKKFANTLLNIIKEDISKLEETKNEPKYALDIIWKKLQSISNWYCLKPKIGLQRESYSDIIKQNVFYNC